MKTNWFKIDYTEISLRLVTLIEYGEPIPFLILKNYLKIGKECKDCNRNYQFCNCNECKNCKFSAECICNLNSNPTSWGIEEYNLIRKEIFKWISFNLNKKYIKGIIDEFEKIRKNLSIQNEELKYIRKNLSVLEKIYNEN